MARKEEHSFAGFYEYYDNGNVSNAQFHNPQIQLGSTHNHYHQSFSYDGLGKLTDVSYDHRNLPTRFHLATNDTVLAGYNADGQRILKETSSGAWQFYVMDGLQTLAVIDNTGFSHFNLVGNGTFGRWEPGGARRYYVTDHLGSTRAVVDDAGNVLETFDYYPFGLFMPKRNTAGANTIEKFTGKERDDEGGLNLDYFGARYYDPAVPRFITVDPILGERNPSELLQTEPRLLTTTPYGYVFGNPTNLADPDGRCPSCLEQLKTIFSYDETYLGDLFRADQQGQLEQKISQDLNDAGNAVVDAGAGLADKVADASTIAAAGGLVAAPFTGGGSLTVTGYALTAGVAADATSTALKTVDAVAFDGTKEAVIEQGIKLGSNIVAGKLGSKVGSAFVRVAQTGGQATRVVPLSEGLLITRDVAVDATRVAVPIITKEILKNNQ